MPYPPFTDTAGAMAGLLIWGDNSRTLAHFLQRENGTLLPDSWDDIVPEDPIGDEYEIRLGY